jgi:vancomycin aglycone glucosyltransferase
MVAGTVRAQFEALGAEAPRHDVMVAAGTLQLAARSVCEARGLPYVFAGYCPWVVPSGRHPPVEVREHHRLDLPAAENAALWAAEEAHWDDLFGPALNEGRAAIGLPPVTGVLGHLLTDRPWLATDPLLGPAPAVREVVQTGAWRLPDPTPLPAELERFLDAGEPPVYLGLGSNRAAPAMGAALLDAARSVGRRAVLSRGWAELLPDDRGGDWISVGDVSHDALFPRVAAVVHHGGAGTTHTAAAAGRVQVVLPHHYDQFSWGERVEALGIGVHAAEGRPVAAERVRALLEAALAPERVARAAELGPRIVRDGARVAAERILGV